MTICQRGGGGYRVNRVFQPRGYRDIRPRADRTAGGRAATRCVEAGSAGTIVMGLTARVVEIFDQYLLVGRGDFGTVLPILAITVFQSSEAGSPITRSNSWHLSVG